jgi:hypothetical protein
MQQAASSLLFAVFGPPWRAKAPDALGRSRRSVQRWAAGEVRMPRAVRQLLEREAATRATLAQIERWALAEHERIDAIRAEWLALASELRTRLKLMAIEEARHPPRGPGRPRKRRRLALSEREPPRIRPARLRIPSAPHGPLQSVPTDVKPRQDDSQIDGVRSATR